MSFCPEFAVFWQEPKGRVPKKLQTSDKMTLFLQENAKMREKSYFCFIENIDFLKEISFSTDELLVRLYSNTHYNAFYMIFVSFKNLLFWN